MTGYSIDVEALRNAQQQNSISSSEAAAGNGPPAKDFSPWQPEEDDDIIKRQRAYQFSSVQFNIFYSKIFTCDYTIKTLVRETPSDH